MISSYAPRPADRYPNMGTLTAVLNQLFPESAVTVLERKPNLYESSFASEILRCAFQGGREERWLFCKYGTQSRVKSAGGHRGDVSFEARVYREVLQPMGATAPTLYGVHEGRDSTWLVLEYLSDGVRTWMPRPVFAAARWAGEFHARNEERAGGLGFLRRYDRSYYLGWIERANSLIGTLPKKVPWFPSLSEAFKARLDGLTDGPLTVIHGEYYPANVLHEGPRVRPVDWQSTAVAKGEIDLASLTQGWPLRVVRRAEREYRMARWGERAPENFRETLELARVYMIMRWLGDPSQTKITRKSGKYLKELRAAGRRLGLISGGSRA